MLEALGSPGERSILSEQTKAGNGDAGEDEREDWESQQDDEEKSESEENPGRHQSVLSEEESSERKDEKRKAEKEHEEEPDEDLVKDNKGKSRLSFHPKANASRTLMRVSCRRRTVRLIEVLQSAGWIWAGVEETAGALTALQKKWSLRIQMSGRAWLQSQKAPV